MVFDFGVKEVIGGCWNEFVFFYEKFGVKKRSVEKREGIFKVWLGNEMFLILDDNVREWVVKIFISYIWILDKKK